MNGYAVAMAEHPLYGQLKHAGEVRVTGTGVVLHRIPADVRHALSDRGRMMAEDSGGCEIRFVTDSRFVRCTVASLDHRGEVEVYKGGLLHSRHEVKPGEAAVLQLEEPARLKQFRREALLASGFAPEVWRIVMGRFTAELRELNVYGHTVRAPREDEVPALRWLAYGSSITHGLIRHPMSYIQQAARRLGADVCNLGLSGSCLCEPELADYLAHRQDWDLLTLELGVNARDIQSEEQFRERTGQLLEKLLKQHPDQAVVVITMYPNFATYPWEETETSLKDVRFNRILREHVDRLGAGYPKLALIEGHGILTDCSGLSCDLVHPGEYGHAVMAENLARRLARIVDQA